MFTARQAIAYTLRYGHEQTASMLKSLETNNVQIYNPSKKLMDKHANATCGDEDDTTNTTISPSSVYTFQNQQNGLSPLASNGSSSSNSVSSSSSLISSNASSSSSSTTTTTTNMNVE